MSLPETVIYGTYLSSENVSFNSIGTGPRRPGLFGRFLVQDVDVHLHLHDVLYRIHIRIVANAESLPVDPKAGAKPPSVVLVEDLSDFDVELFGHSAQYQVAGHSVGSIAGLRDLLRDQRDLRIGRDVEKVFAAQMIVAHRDAGVDAGRLDGDLEGGVFDLHRVQLDLGVPLVEITVGGDESRLSHEIDLAVRVVDDVRPRLGGHRDRGQ